MNAEDTDMVEEVADSNALFEPVQDSAEMMEDVSPIQEVSTSAEPKPPDDPYTGSYEWRIDNFSKNTEGKLYSEKFEIGTYFWRMLVFPRGNKVQSLSVYLDAPEATYTPLHMSPKAAFKLVLINQFDGSRSFVKETQHTFTSHETDWGFTQFFPLDELLDTRKGFLLEDTIVLKVEITIQKDERYAYDSRKETCHVGLKNQGATCYMNSLLQYLYHLPYFRKAVYHMPTAENDEPSKCIPLALQSLFYKLQYSKTSVSTKDLTKSFGWGTYDAFMQHDVQELNRVLCEKLEEKMKGTQVERVITELFEGHTNNFIQCMHVDYKSARKESFMDLQLDVKGCKDIYASFEKYCEIETLEGANQYKAEGFGLQDAKKGVLFEDFPPVLQLQLKRFEYDFQRDQMVKINDRYEFSEELDLDIDGGKFLAPAADKSVRNLYKLHSVLVHSGGVHGGHYYAFIRPDGKTWLKFDDERVTIEDKSKALSEQFGGEDENPPPAPGYGNAPTFKFTKYSNAYMLVYIRVSDWERIMCDVTKDDIADHLRKRLEQEQAEKEQRQKEKAEAHLYCHLKIATDKDLKDQIGRTRHFDLVDHDSVKSYRIKKQTKFTDFKLMVAEDLGIPVEKQRYWTWARRQNHTYRPARPLRPDEEELSLMDLREHREQGGPTTKHALMDLKLYLESPSETTGSLFKISKHDIFLFFKMYDPQTETLAYVGRFFAHKNTKLQELFPVMCKLAGFEEEVDLDCFEEIKFEPTVMCERIDKRHALSPQAQLEDGDIICFQKVLTAEEAARYRHPYVKGYLEYIRNRRLVNFRKLEDPKEEGCTLELLKDMTYDQVNEALAQHLKLDNPKFLRLTQHNAYSHQPQRTPIKYQAINRLEQMLQHGNHTNEILYYEVLDIPLDDLEKLKTLKVAFHNDKTELASEHSIRLPRESTIGDVLNELKKVLGKDYQDKKFRLMEVFNSKVFKTCDPDENIEAINDAYWNLRAEVVPDDEVSKEGERLIHVYHFNSDKENPQLLTIFGDPFFLKIRDDETLGEIKQRIQTKLGISDEEYAKWKFAFVSIRYPPEYLNDDDVVAVRFAKAHTQQTSEPNYLGLEHEDKAPKRSTQSYRYTYERPVKIYN